MNDLETRIKQGKKATTLAKERGMDTSLWEKELARLETLAQAEQTAEHTRELLITRGWCLWKCSVLAGEIIAVVLDENVEGVPEGYPVYTMAELEELCQDDISETTLRLVHEMKKIAGAKVTSIVTAMKEETDGEARIEVHLRKGDQEHHSLSGGARRRSPQQ